MKKFKQITSFQPAEWEEDDIWIAKRLTYLRDLSDRNPRLYCRNNLRQEKENIYILKPEAVGIAQNLVREQCMKEKKDYE